MQHAFRPNPYAQRIIDLRNQNLGVVVVGLGVSGIAAAHFLVDCGLTVFACEALSREDFYSRTKSPETVKELEAQGLQIVFQAVHHVTDQILDTCGMAVISPGVSLDGPLVTSLRERGIILTSEFELGLGLLALPTILVTGSNGKSTTTVLIEHLLRAGGLKATACGNLGVPMLKLLKRDGEAYTRTVNEGYLVVEASSYQLEACHELKPQIGVFLNLSDNHLERHGSIDTYFAAKANAFILQDESDTAIFSRDDLWTRRLVGVGKGQKYTFGSSSIVASAVRGAQAHETSVQVVWDENQEIFDLAHTNLKQAHNRLNAAAGILAALSAGVSAGAIREGLATFVGLSHRQEILSQQPLIINDSKSTTVASAVAALGSTREMAGDKKITLMIGGQPKQGSWQPLREALKTCQPIDLVIFGGGRVLIAKELEDYSEAARVYETMTEAIQNIRPTLDSESVLLFSPACASFDEFKNFEHRGDVFKASVT